MNTGESGESSICVLLFDNDSRDGGWTEFLIANGYTSTIGPTPLNNNVAFSMFRTYCKAFTKTEFFPSLSPSLSFQPSAVLDVILMKIENFEDKSSQEKDDIISDVIGLLEVILN